MIAKVTLLDYINAHRHSVLFFVSEGIPIGCHIPLGHSDIDFVERRDLLLMNGTVNDQNEWSWDGNGKPTDDNNNSIYQMEAFINQSLWEKLDQQFQNGD